MCYKLHFIAGATWWKITSRFLWRFLSSEGNMISIFPPNKLFAPFAWNKQPKKNWTCVGWFGSRNCRGERYDIEIHIFMNFPLRIFMSWSRNIISISEFWRLLVETMVGSFGIIYEDCVLVCGNKNLWKEAKRSFFGFHSGILIGNVYQPIFIAGSQREMRWFLEAFSTWKEGKSLK